MEYQISFPISIKFFEKYMKHFPYLNVINKSKRKDNEFYIIDTETEYHTLNLTIKMLMCIIQVLIFVMIVIERFSIVKILKL